MSDKGEASNPAGRDIYSAFLLLSTAFDDAGPAALPQLMDGPPGSVAYVSPGLDSGSSLADMPGRLVRSALWQMYANLLLSTESDEAELVHQARIGWRRLRSSCRLLRAMDDLPAPPPVEPLHALIDQLRELRDVDVAGYEILPRLGALTPGGIAADDQEWRRLCAALEAEARAHRAVLRRLLVNSAVGEALWELVLWLLQLRDLGQRVPAHTRDGELLAQWARHHVGRIHRAFRRAQVRCRDAETRHRARIWAKRLRYASEDFGNLLPDTAKKWRKKASLLQSRLGEQRDLQTAAALAERHGAARIASRIRQLAADLMAVGS